ncbi:MAG: ADP-ribosylglycohydrolase family protein, partial [Gammaproteobacteria bacterium]|nr:ADP-ribosylglycohydrolase family protein [Gammaproteobacteria bacterium]
MALPDDYEERVYAGVLGKIIGVYLGRPFEGWTNARIEERLGDINYYVHDALDVPLVVTDDDISGTLTFIRALADNGHDPDISPAQIGNTWLNYLIEGRTVLWWGGLGNSTEHTAYLRLKQGIEAPRSGSSELNGKVVSEQIGAQIFIDGWAMVSPGDPERAAELARRAASVSHDGEAIYGAQVLAAMEALAFEESDIDKLIDVGTSMIPGNSAIYGMIQDLRSWHAQHPADWRKTFARIQAQYGYDKYGGNCHMVPNHALIVMSLLHGDGDFQKSLMIVNTAGWDTDCNSGNVGCLMGIRGGLDAIDAGPDWRTPVADRIYLPTADAGSA